MSAVANGMRRKKLLQRAGSFFSGRVCIIDRPLASCIVSDPLSYRSVPQCRLEGNFLTRYITGTVVQRERTGTRWKGWRVQAVAPVVVIGRYNI